MLVRAGYMRGRNYLFLGRRVLDKIAANIRREMEAIGAQELLIADSASRLAEELRSYRQLPQTWFEIAGLSMKGYTFDLDGRAYDAMASVVTRICGPEQREGFPDSTEDLAPEEFYTPNQKSIADIAAFTCLPPTMQMKSLVMVADGETVLALVRGDHQLDREKLKWALDTRELRPAETDEIRAAFGANPGSLGPIGVKIRTICDEALRGRRNLICGANRDDYHLRNVTPEKDFSTEFHDLRDDTAPVARMRHGRSSLQVTNESAALVNMHEGACEVFLDRLLESTAEKHADGDGLMWPASIAPFQMVVTPVNIADDAQRQAAIALHDAAPLDILVDDRDERPGVKFKDADLTGIPFRITIGKKLTDGIVEVKRRGSKAAEDVPIAEALAFVSKGLK